MDIQTTTQQQPVSDDNELAKVLGGGDDANKAVSDVTADATPETNTTPPATDTAAPGLTPPPIASAPSQTLSENELEVIKKAALDELKPLVDKLQLPPEEKFDILLLIIRSTDDKELIGTAHETAKTISDETRRAQALLDIIKEVEYFSNNAQQEQPPVQAIPGAAPPVV